MSTKNLDVFYENPGKVEQHVCRVCGTVCDVKRNVMGPTGWAEGMAKRAHLHDRFSCPYTSKDWHDQAAELVEAIEETPSPRVAALMRQDLQDLLRAHGIQPIEPKEQNDAA